MITAYKRIAPMRMKIKTSVGNMKVGIGFTLIHQEDVKFLFNMCFLFIFNHDGTFTIHKYKEKWNKNLWMRHRCKGYHKIKARNANRIRIRTAIRVWWEMRDEQFVCLFPQRPQREYCRCHRCCLSISTLYLTLKRAHLPR